jgi:hypothetical protein
MAQLGNVNSWAGADRPEKPDFQHTVSAARAAIVTEAVSSAFGSGVNVNVKGMLRDYDQFTKFYGGSEQGIYAVDVNGGPLVVHIKDKASEDIMAFGADVFKHLYSEGVPTTQYIAGNGAYVHPARSYAAYFTDHATGQHPVSRPDVLEAFGKAIGAMEQAFETLPQDMKETILQNSGDRYKSWEDGLAHFDAKGTVYETAHPDARAVLQYCADFLRDRMPKMEDGGPAHFDLIEANTLFTEATQPGSGIETKILDCDTLRSGWAPPHYDLGTFAFRVGLNMPVDTDTDILPAASADTLEPLRKGYNEASGANMSQQEFVEHAMTAAALVMMVIPAIDSRNSKVLPEIEHHTKKMTEKVGRMMAVHQAMNP